MAVRLSWMGPLFQFSSIKLSGNGKIEIKAEGSSYLADAK